MSASGDCCSQISLTHAKIFVELRQLYHAEKIAVRVLQNDEIRTRAIPPWIAPRSKL